MADDFDLMLAGVAGNFVEIKIRCGDGEFIVNAVFKPVALPAFVPALDKKAADAKADGGVDVF